MPPYTVRCVPVSVNKEVIGYTLAMMDTLSCPGDRQDRLACRLWICQLSALNSKPLLVMCMWMLLAMRLITKSLDCVRIEKNVPFTYKWDD